MSTGCGLDTLSEGFVDVVHGRDDSGQVRRTTREEFRAIFENLKGARWNEKQEKRE